MKTSILAIGVALALVASSTSADRGQRGDDHYDVRLVESGRNGDHDRDGNYDNRGKGSYDHGKHYGWYRGPKGGWLGGGSNPHQTPEIDPGMLRTGLLLLVAGMLVLTDRRRS